MKKWAIILFMVFGMAEMAYAQGFGHCAFGSYTFGDCIISSISGGITGGGTGGGGGAGGKVEYGPKEVILMTPYYDILINNISSNYQSGEILHPIITIINKGHNPDKDATLVYYLLSPSGQIIGESMEMFEEVLPTCPNATYDRFKDICQYENGTTSDTYKIVLEREIALPLDAEQGQWRFYVKYESRVYPFIDFYKIEVYQTFRVGLLKISNSALVIISIILLYLYTQNNRNKRRMEEYLAHDFKKL